MMLSGCGARFSSESGEHAYLSSLSNPTPEQWQRKNSLTEKLAREALESLRREKAAASAAYNDPAAVARRAKEENEEADRRAKEQAQRDSERVAELMSGGMEKERKGEPGMACSYYKRVMEEYPNAPEAPAARERLRACRKLAYGLDDGQ